MIMHRHTNLTTPKGTSRHWAMSHCSNWHPLLPVSCNHIRDYFISEYSIILHTREFEAATSCALVSIHCSFVWICPNMESLPSHNWEGHIVCLGITQGESSIITAHSVFDSQNLLGNENMLGDEIDKRLVGSFNTNSGGIFMPGKQRNVYHSEVEAVLRKHNGMLTHLMNQSTPNQCNSSLSSRRLLFWGCWWVIKLTSVYLNEAFKPRVGAKILLEEPIASAFCVNVNSRLPIVIHAQTRSQKTVLVTQQNDLIEHVT